MLNAATKVVRVAPPVSLDFSAVFARAFPALSTLHSSFPADGVLIVAVWDGSHVDDYVHVPVGADVSSAVFGRHDRCDLQLARDPSVSLRHTLVSLQRQGLTELRVRAWDLDSGIGMRAETGAVYEALIAEGPLFLRIGSYHLFLFPTGSLCPAPWGRTALDTWASFPERVLIEERAAPRPPRPSLRDSLDDETSRPSGRAATITQVVPAAGSLWSHAPDPSDSSVTVAHVDITDGVDAISVPVSDRQIERGVLIGRYDRCQVVAQPNALSRVHLLVVRDDGDTWVFDVASTNGTRVAGQRIRHRRLTADVELVLAHSITMRWRV